MIAELIEKRLRLHHDNTALMQKVKADGREVPNPDEEQEWQSRDAAIEALSKQIERLKKQQHDRVDARRTGDAQDRAHARQWQTAALAVAPGAGLTRLRQSHQDFVDALRGWFVRGQETAE